MSRPIVFWVDGRAYKVQVKTIKRHGVVTDGKNAGRLDVSYEMDREGIGTFYNYDMELKTEDLNFEEYDELYEILTDPDKEFHTVKLPYAQGYLTFEAYTTQVDDELDLMTEDNNLWTNMVFQFVAKKPQREAS